MKDLITLCTIVALIIGITLWLSPKIGAFVIVTMFILSVVELTIQIYQDLKSSQK